MTSPTSTRGSPPRSPRRSSNGRADDLFSHVGIVEAVRGSEVSIIHLGGTGVERIELNLKRRGTPRENSVLRRRSPADPSRTRYLAGQLLAGFSSPLRRGELLAARARQRHRPGGK